MPTKKAPCLLSFLPRVFGQEYPGFPGKKPRVFWGKNPGYSWVKTPGVSEGKPRVFFSVVVGTSVSERQAAKNIFFIGSMVIVEDRNSKVVTQVDSNTSGMNAVIIRRISPIVDLRI